MAANSPKLERINEESDTYLEKIDEDTYIKKQSILGFGGFGSVFLGEYKKEMCAIKMLYHHNLTFSLDIHIKLPVSKQERELAEKFRKECEALKDCKHINVVSYLDTKIHPKSGIPILVMERLDCDLSCYLIADEYKSTITKQCEISISKDVACGLAYIHSQEYIHRDLYGKNVLLKLNGTGIPIAKIADFGMSKLFDPFRENTTQQHRRGYLPPEALHDEYDENGKLKDYDLSLDVFSCGVIMIQIAFRVEIINDRHIRERYLSILCQYESEVYAHPLKPFILACVNKDKTKRPSAAKLGEDLKERLGYSETIEANGFVNIELSGEVRYGAER